MIRNIFIGALALTIIVSGGLSVFEMNSQSAATVLAQYQQDPFSPPPFNDWGDAEDPREGGGSTPGTNSGGGDSGGGREAGSGGGREAGSGGGREAGSGGGNTGNILRNPLTFDTIEEFFAGLLKFIVRVGFIVVTVALIWVGFLFVQAQGRPEKITQAKEALLWTLVGALILLGAEAIAIAIQATITDIQNTAT